jgi:hypothetical protein
MSGRGLALAAALALGAVGCAHSLAGGAARGPAGRVPALGSFAVRAGTIHAKPPRDIDPLAILEARLLARGASEVSRVEEPVPGEAEIDLFLVGDRATPLTRWTSFPLGLVTIATVGLVPHREAHEHVIELHAVLPRAPPGRRVRVARRSYVDVTWIWLPLAFTRDAPAGGSAAEQRRVHEEGLARAIDEALDEVLAPPDVPGPIAH